MVMNPEVEEHVLNCQGLIEYHLLYNLKGGPICNTKKWFKSMGDAEIWLEKQGAIYWEIAEL